MWLTVLPSMKRLQDLGGLLENTEQALRIEPVRHFPDLLMVEQSGHEDLDGAFKPLEDVADIYYGLADAYRLSGKFEQAYIYGKMALRLYEKRSLRYWEGRMHNVLGRICFQMGQSQDAGDHYMEALSAATLDNTPGMMMLNFAALADLRLAEGRLEEAKRFCQRAQEVGEHVNDDHLRGLMCLVYGKVAYAETEQTQGEQRQKLLEEAIRWFENAKEQLSLTQASTNLAEVYGRLAQAYEELGRHQEAVEHWKAAYNLLTENKSTWWY